MITTATNSFIIQPLLGKMKLDYREYTLVAGLALDEFVLAVPANAPHRTARDLVEAARRRPKTICASSVAVELRHKSADPSLSSDLRVLSDLRARALVSELAIAASLTPALTVCLRPCAYFAASFANCRARRKPRTCTNRLRLDSYKRPG